MSPPILAAVILGGFALVALLGLIVWIHHRKATRIAATKQQPKIRKRYNWYPQSPEEVGHWDDGSGARTLQRMSLAARRASSVFAGKRSGIARGKHVKIETKEHAARSHDGVPVYEGI